jgi:NAD(P)-dependent dehydrogenase (short-subunit alcohol dehydrogenase family)
MNPVGVVTGASRGIGRGIAIELAAAGFDLVLNYARNADAAMAAVAACRAAGAAVGRSVRASAVAADVAVAEDRDRLLARVRSEFGRLDLLVNNAGVAPETRADLLETGEASFDRLMAINVKGPFFLTQAAARWMIQQETAERSAGNACPVAGVRRKIVTVTSISAYTASVNRGEYCMAKAALAMLTPLFAARLAEHGITVFEIRPGIVATDMTAPVRDKYDRLIAEGLTPIRRWGTPADVGKAVAAIAQDAFPFSTGEVFNIDGGFHLRRL